MYSPSGNTCRIAEGEASQSAGSVGTLAQERSRRTNNVPLVSFKMKKFLVVNPFVSLPLSVATAPPAKEEHYLTLSQKVINNFIIFLIGLRKIYLKTAGITPIYIKSKPCAIKMNTGRFESSRFSLYKYKVIFFYY
jgi:hypothetical protein